MYRKFREKLGLAGTSPNRGHSTSLERKLKDYEITTLTQIVYTNGIHSNLLDLCSGVPRGSVLGHVHFILYTQLLSSIIDHDTVFHQLYTEGTQKYKSSHPNEVIAAIHGVERCIYDVKSWMTCGNLKMNNDKTEAVLITT